MQDAARLVDPAYAAAADRAALLREEAAQVEKSIRHYEGILRRDQEQGDKRWREMGFLRQVMHKTGMRRDHALDINEGAEHTAVEALDKLEPRRVRAGQAAPGSREGRGRRLRAGAAGRGGRAGAASGAGDPRPRGPGRTEERDRERQRERSRDRDHGMER